MIIEQPSAFLRIFYPNALWRIRPEEKAVYLTFDDGPIPDVTPRVLKMLDHYGIKATFFMVGNHLGGFTTSTRSYVRNVHKADELIHSNLFRPPHGWLRHLQYHFLKRHFKLVMWDVVTRDYSKRLNADEVFENVKRYTRPGSIITFHDSLRSADKLWSALPRSIEWLQKEGYEFKMIP